MYHMKTVTVRDLRYNFPKVERMLREGKPLRITKRGKVIAKLEPENGDGKTAERPPLPDFEARMRANYGDKIFEVSGAELISADREDRF
jgi:antitoxin (DNA-binding transcriptional repressor) of toxin-antitoxin stability system